VVAEDHAVAAVGHGLRAGVRQLGVPLWMNGVERTSRT
jgi:hypothetical protein